MNDYVIFGDDEAFAGKSYYGDYRTRTFANIFPSYEEFAEAYNASALKIEFSAEGQPGLSLPQLFYMLYAHYGNSHIAYSDENQFVYYLWSIIYQYGPTVIKKREIQDKLRALDKDNPDEFFRGSKAIHNHSFNPSTEPSTSTLEELLTINDQNTTNYKKSYMDAYANLLALLDEDVVDDFIHKFRRLFIKVLAPDYPLLYTTEAN